MGVALQSNWSPKSTPVRRLVAQAQINSSKLSSLPLRPIHVPRLHDQSLLPGHHLQFAELRDTNRLVRNESEAILTAQLLLQKRENLVNASLFRYLVVPAAGLP